MRVSGCLARNQAVLPGRKSAMPGITGHRGNASIAAAADVDTGDRDRVLLYLLRLGALLFVEGKGSSDSDHGYTQCMNGPGIDPHSL